MKILVVLMFPIYCYVRVRIGVTPLESVLVFAPLLYWYMCLLLNKEKKTVRLTLIYMYLWSLLDILFIHAGLRLPEGQMLYKHINLIPFKTILLYINGYHNGYVSLELFLLNILGNIILFTPFGYLLPRVKEQMRSYLKFIFFSICLIVFVEVMQYNMYVGSLDIDDLILNLIGVHIGYFVYLRRSRHEKERHHL